MSTDKFGASYAPKIGRAGVKQYQSLPVALAIARRAAAAAGQRSETVGIPPAAIVTLSASMSKARSASNNSGAAAIRWPLCSRASVPAKP